RCLLDGIPGMRLPGAAVYPRSRSLRTSRGPGGYAVTPALGGRGLHPHGKLSYKVHLNLAVFLGTKVPFRPTGRTYISAEISDCVCSLQLLQYQHLALTYWKPHVASTWPSWTCGRERSETSCCTCRWKSCRRNSPFGAVVISGSPRGGLEG